MVNLPSPLIVAALSAAAVLYAPFPGVRLCLLILAAAGTAALLLGISPLFQQVQRIRQVRFPVKIPLHTDLSNLIVPVISALLGTIAGLWIAPQTAAFAPGLPVDSIISVKGKLLDDPRSLPAFTGTAFPLKGPEEERGMAALELAESAAVLPGTSGVRSSARGRALVFFPAGTMPRLREFGRGAEIYAEGRFLSGGPDGTASRFRASSVHVVQPAPAGEQLRTALRASFLERLTSKPWGGLTAALLMGTRENLDDGLNKAFRDSGLAHILALSGMHLAFLSALLALALKRPLGKKGAIRAGLGFILLYVALVGPQPSLVRAAIMYIMGSCLVLGGNTREPYALLAAAFLIQSAADPPSAMGPSFIFSYLAMGGILILSGRLGSILRGRLPPSLVEALCVSIGAFLFTAPAAAGFFGILRPAGIIAGLAVIPLSSLFMALSLAWIPAAEIPLAGSLLDTLLGLVQSAMKGCAAFFAAAPGIKASAAAVSLAALPLAAALLFLAKRHEHHRNYLAPFA